MKFIDAKDTDILFLELGVGYNTPVIIRYPFEQLTEAYPKASLYRVNRSHGRIPQKLGHKGMGIEMDIDNLLTNILSLEKQERSD